MKRTAKEEVIAAHPEATAWTWRDCWVIYVRPDGGQFGNSALGCALASEDEAWADAARRLKAPA